MTGKGTPDQPDPFDYADDFQGDLTPDPWHLTEDEERYRAEAYEKVLHYTRDYGLAILPVHWMASETACSCRQGELCDLGNNGKGMAKHPCDLRWPEVATSDPEQAARWWRPPQPGEPATDWRPRANVGYRTGGRRFTTDVDTDDGKPGAASLARLEEQGGEKMPVTLTYRTGGGGTQYVTLAPEGVEVRNSASKIAPGIDLRGYNGFCILPPSRSAKGEYVMLIDVCPDVPCAGWEADWLREQHSGRTEHIRRHPCGDPRQIPKDGLTKRAHAYITAAFKDAVTTVASAPDGQRNQSLNDETFDMFSKFVPAGLLSADDVAAAMQEAGESCGLEPGAVSATIESAWIGGQRKDRSSEVPDFLFAEPGDESEDRPQLPGLVPMVYEFERTYTLRRTEGGEFVSRPDLVTGLPALTCDIGDELGHRLRRWWRTQAETWEDYIAKLIAQATGEEANGKDEDKEHAAVCPPDATFTNALSHLRASADQHPRVVRHFRCFDDPDQRRIVVDLANDRGQVVEITPDGFEVKDLRAVDGEPWFARNSDMQPQAVPVQPGNVLAALEEAREVFNVTPEQWKIILAAAAVWHFASIPRPGGWLSGVSGTGKTTRGWMWAGLVDPVEFLDNETDAGIAVGTALAGGPPRRSQRAGLPHWAPAMSIWRRTAARGMGAQFAAWVASVGRGAPSVPR